MHLTDLQHEGGLEKFCYEPIEQRQPSTDFMLPEERRGQPRLRHDVGELAETHIDMDAGRVQDPSPLPSCAVWFDEEHFTGKAPRCGEILLGFLALSLEIL